MRKDSHPARFRPLEVSPVELDGQTEAIGRGVGRVLGLARDVAVLHWPEEAPEAARLAAAGLPRLLLVDAGNDPPESDDCQEDWVRLPADDRDVAARLRALT